MPSEYPGYFSDGRTADRRAVIVTLAASALEITSDGALLARWPYEELRAADPIRQGAPLRLSRGSGDARLTLAGETVANGSILADLATRAPQLVPSRRRVWGRAVCRLGLVLGGVAAAVAVLWFFWPPLADVIAEAVPRSWEDRLGRQVVAGLTADHRVCADPAGTAALDRLVARLAANATLAGPLTVSVVDFPQVNAFAAPGGHIVLLRGLLETAESADELAGVLAHEIGHVVEHHGIRSLVRYLGLALLFQVISGDEGFGRITPMLLTLAYSRDFETAADAHAVELLVHAGIRTDGLPRFFARLERKEGHLPAVLTYLSTHPSTAERRLATTRAAPGGGPAMTAEAWSALQRICDR